MDAFIIYFLLVEPLRLLEFSSGNKPTSAIIIVLGYDTIINLFFYLEIFVPIRLNSYNYHKI